MKKTIYEELMILDRKARALWSDVNNVGKRQPTLKDDTRFMELQASMIYFTDMLNQLTREHQQKELCIVLYGYGRIPEHRSDSIGTVKLGYIALTGGIARDVPRKKAEQIQQFMEKVGYHLIILLSDASQEEIEKHKLSPVS